MMILHKRLILYFILVLFDVESKSLLRIVYRHALVHVVLDLAALEGCKNTFVLDAFCHGSNLQIALFHGICLEISSHLVLGKVSKGQTSFSSRILHCTSVGRSCGIVRCGGHCVWWILGCFLRWRCWAFQIACVV